MRHVDHFGHGRTGLTLGGAAELAGVIYLARDAENEGEVMRQAIKQRLQWCLNSDRKANDTPLWKRDPLFRGWHESKLRAPQGEWVEGWPDIELMPSTEPPTFITSRYPGIPDIELPRLGSLRFRRRFRWRWA